MWNQIPDPDWTEKAAGTLLLLHECVGLLRSSAPERLHGHVIWPSIIMCRAILTYQGKETSATVTPPVWHATAANSHHTNNWLFGSAFLWNSICRDWAQRAQCCKDFNAFSFCPLPFFWHTHQKSWWVIANFGYGLFLDWTIKISLLQMSDHEDPQSFEHLTQFRVYNSIDRHAFHILKLGDI